MAIAAGVGLAAILGGATADGAEPAGSLSLRVCADPDNMPFSNETGEGFENKHAELIAQQIEARLEYSWFSEATGYVPNTMGRGACDLVMGYAQGTELIEDTNPYYYTSYVLIYRQDDAGLAGVDRLSDARLKGKRIGFFARTPPASILAMHGLVAYAKPFEIQADESAAKAARTLMAEVASGELDAGLLWGPVGGYYAQRAGVVPLKLVPLVKENAGPNTIYGITMGVRPNEPQWKHKINKLIAENQGEINVILEGYNVPLLDDKGNLITAAAAER
ncbi:MAG: quinoprotein dehydrogenase-associated putative ABC transporter substrate-binding protein [Methyloceanibacter sp.]|nr:quinoprotein dehydrogenase-associated putative ABC transporter substrate-binding protein [Methyloceanibacter sp.]